MRLELETFGSLPCAHVRPCTHPRSSVHLLLLDSLPWGRYPSRRGLGRPFPFPLLSGAIRPFPWVVRPIPGTLTGRVGAHARSHGSASRRSQLGILPRASSWWLAVSRAVYPPPPSTLLDLIGVIKAHGLTSSNKLQAFNIETIKGTN